MTEFHKNEWQANNSFKLPQIETNPPKLSTACSSIYNTADLHLTDILPEGGCSLSHDPKAIPRVSRLIGTSFYFLNRFLK